MGGRYYKDHPVVSDPWYESNESVSFSTTDHKPTNDAERERIVKAGGLVMTQRINGSLAVSRALGDFDYK